MNENRQLHVDDLAEDVEGVEDVFELTDEELAMVAGSLQTMHQPTSSGGDGGTDS